jgi:hypothetical protein
MTYKGHPPTYRAVFALAIFFFAGTISAYAVKELSLEEKVKRSDIVFIGRVVSVSESMCFKEHRCAEVDVSTMLKGKKQALRVLWGGPITEFDPACCDVGTDYLFFLKRRKGVFFETVNAYHGVYELPKPQAK